MSDTKGPSLEAFELKPKELEGVVGGMGGSSHKLPPKKGLEVYKIRPRDTLTKIASAYHTTASYLLSINPTITNRNDLTAGYYIYVPAR